MPGDFRNMVGEGTQLLRALSSAMTELAVKVSPGVVGVNAGRGTGAGIVWSDDGLILTANHVVGRSAPPSVRLEDGREVAAKMVGGDPYSDVSLVRVEGAELVAVERGNADDVRVGEFVLALTRAFDGKPSATSGIVTTRSRSLRGFWGARIDDAILSDARIDPGYSGGPLVDASGRLVGMNVAYFAGRGVAVSVNALTQIIPSLLAEGKAKKGYLGVVVEPIKLPEELQLSGIAQEGLLVRSVESGSPARSAGALIGDVILQVGDTLTTDEYELRRALSGNVVGKTLALKVLRAEKVTELAVSPKDAE
jgi:S1-C subfamily serine protease